ncbi:MAG: hypothetical protein V1737_02700 [Chloroflexota bacterium]
MTDCGHCRLPAPRPRGGFNYSGVRRGETRMTPDTNADKCKKFQKKWEREETQ